MDPWPLIANEFSGIKPSGVGKTPEVKSSGGRSSGGKTPDAAEGKAARGGETPEIKPSGGKSSGGGWREHDEEGVEVLLDPWPLTANETLAHSQTHSLSPRLCHPGLPSLFHTLSLSLAHSLTLTFAHSRTHTLTVGCREYDEEGVEVLLEGGSVAVDRERETRRPRL